MLGSNWEPWGTDNSIKQFLRELRSTSIGACAEADAINAAAAPRAHQSCSVSFTLSLFLPAHIQQLSSEAIVCNLSSVAQLLLESETPCCFSSQNSQAERTHKRAHVCSEREVLENVFLMQFMRHWYCSDVFLFLSFLHFYVNKD